jgi:hypothetical protein
MSVLRCSACRLVFRYPYDDPQRERRYYDRGYSENVPTTVPSEGTLQRLLSAHFSGSQWDLADRLRAFQVLAPRGFVLDFGASWGYGTWQMRQRGFEVVGFEVARRRAEFAREHLALSVFDDSVLLKGFIGEHRLDAIFSNHVIEHLGSTIAEAFSLFGSLLRPGGVMFHVLPNFTGKTARQGAFLQWVGRDHPLAPDRDFFDAVLPDYGFHRLVHGTGPFDPWLCEALAAHTGEYDREGDERFLAAWRS